MAKAAEDFFPESDLLSSLTHEDEPRASMSSDRTPRLQRAASGVSSIVGPNNGDRPGGFVLVIDGSALTHVRLTPNTGGASG